MIIRETDTHVVMTAQHEHAQFAGCIASHFLERLFIDPSYRQDTIMAITEHDRSWIRLDETPIWNDRHAVPFSFGDYPLLPKLLLYQYGLDETEAMNEYAALLCSLHYSSFRHIRNSKQPDCMAFIHNEAERQRRIQAKLNVQDESMVGQHLKLLQLCDEISLYVCLNEPGATKEDEHPWYREGFETLIDDQRLAARWVSGGQIQINPFPFKQAFSAAIHSKHVSKEAIQRLGIDTAYKETPLMEQTVTFVGQT
ncbi:DUF3891 family protein [Paenibacillus mendelii]|uniref:DUF3891 family protein n=1 Tax=Paenibacillus mendelii TaxID=206163 RepID=A0ABV6J6C2_9BACL|nr:DUF3891 family protein [Paenibacillus mendelii]MCQ6561238.1 DUF3891 family protein [Paenibacillus mendelii]